MKKIIYSFSIVFSLAFISCQPDSQDDPLAPTSDARDKFIATWNVSENSATVGTTAHTTNITKSTSSSSEIVISNFSGLSVSARATVNNNNLIIPYQQIGTIGFAKGSGILSGSNTINLTYTTTVNGSKDSCTAIYTKQ